jgi:hypothetical protein
LEILMLGALVLQVRCVAKLFPILILFWSADAGAETYHLADQASEPRNSGEADAASSRVLFTAPEQLVPECEHAGGEAKALDLIANECRAPALPAEIPMADETSDDVCSAIVREAMASDLPVEFFTRLIWQESRFNPRARSYKGAVGIAQFMPGTARWRGLQDSYNPFQSLQKSAQWLAELRDQFGNVGLAAAAYNAGPGRVQNWLSGRASLPSETRHYVRTITGASADEWSKPPVKDYDHYSFSTLPCKTIAQAVSNNYHRSVTASSIGSSDHSPGGEWGLQLIGDWSETRALTYFRKLQEQFPTILGNRKPLVLKSQPNGRSSATWYRIRVAEYTREQATELCRKLGTAGGKCIVLRN